MMRYSREELVMIRQQVERSEYLEARVPGAIAYLFASILALGASVIGMVNGGDIWAFAIGLSATWFIYRAVAAWSVITQIGNLPIKSLDDIGTPPSLPIMESATRPAPMVQTARNQWRRPNLTGLLTKSDQARMWQAVAANDWRFSRPTLERAGITGLTGYTEAGITCYAALLNELERCGVVVNGRVSEDVTMELKGE